ncbi:hypothetical protein GWI33_008863 [Rhynchophorus ferrugineus]|uniref:Uncharacterized protein n=1 Tax=Rhynchophorus ferrugineus TaxID=354439 RepID=A0A834MH11_RHYFE|nr:hypothetical protein GWI33_008863 [Rhynchophorus ferrugineus]
MPGGARNSIIVNNRMSAEPLNWTGFYSFDRVPKEFIVSGAEIRVRRKCKVGRNCLSLYWDIWSDTNFIGARYSDWRNPPDDGKKDYFIQDVCVALKTNTSVVPRPEQ